MADTVSKKNPVRTRREEEKDMRRQEILDAAEKVIAKHGWPGTDFGKIATRARLSRSLVYFYFPMRDDLFHAVCERGLTDLERRFATVMATRASGLEQCVSLGRAYHAFAVEKPLYFELIAQFQANELDPENQSQNEAAANAHGQGCLGQVAQAVANGLADGSITKNVGDPRPTAVSVWAFTHGLSQIATRKERMLEQGFQMNSAQMMEHGFKLLRSALAAKK
jgi:AcrR family transcriptional regulator